MEMGENLDGSKRCQKCDTVAVLTGTLARTVKTYHCSTCNRDFKDVCEGACDDCEGRNDDCENCYYCMFGLLPLYFDAAHPDGPSVSDQHDGY